MTYETTASMMFIVRASIGPGKGAAPTSAVCVLIGVQFWL